MLYGSGANRLAPASRSLPRYCLWYAQPARRTQSHIAAATKCIESKDNTGALLYTVLRGQDGPLTALELLGGQASLICSPSIYGNPPEGTPIVSLSDWLQAEDSRSNITLQNPGCFPGAVVMIVQQESGVSGSILGRGRNQVSDFGRFGV